jgi:hypothetical protein
MAFKYDKPYIQLMKIDNKKNLEIINLAYEMNSQDILQVMLINKISLSIISDNNDNNLIHTTLLNDNTNKTEFTRLNFIKFLVQNNVNPDQPNNDNQTPLHLACQKQYYTIVEYLVKDCYCNVNYKDNNGLTPLYWLLIGNIKIFEEKENRDLILANKKDSEPNKEEKLEIKKKVLELIEKEPYLKSLEESIYEFLRNNNEIKDILLDNSKRIADTLRLNEPPTPEKTNKEFIEIQKNKIEQIGQKMWNKFANSDRIELHNVEKDSWPNNTTYGIIKNSNYKNELKKDIHNLADDFIKNINTIFENRDKYKEKNLLSEYTKDIASNFFNDNNLIPTGNYNELKYKHKNFNDLRSFDPWNTLHQNNIVNGALDFADNIIDLENLSFIGGSRNIEIDNNILIKYDYNTNNITFYTGNNKSDFVSIFNLLDETVVPDDNIHDQFKKLFLFIFFVDLDLINKQVNGQYLFKYILTNEPGQQMRNSIHDIIDNNIVGIEKQEYKDFIDKYINQLDNPSIALKLYNDYLKLKCIQTPDNLSCTISVLVVKFIATLINKDCTYIGFKKTLLFENVLIKYADIYDDAENQLLLLPILFLYIICSDEILLYDKLYDINTIDQFNNNIDIIIDNTIIKDTSQIPIIINIAKALVKINNESIIDVGIKNKLNKNLNISLKQNIINLIYQIYNNLYNKVSLIILSDFFYLIEDFSVLILYLNYNMDSMIRNIYSTIRFPNDDKIKQFLNLQIPPSYQGYLFCLMDYNNNYNNDNLINKKFYEARTLGLFYKGILPEFELKTIYKDRANIDRFSLKKDNNQILFNPPYNNNPASDPNNYKIIEYLIPLPFNYLFSDPHSIKVNPNSNLIYYQYVPGQYRPPYTKSLENMKNKYNKILYDLLEKIVKTKTDSYYVFLMKLKNEKKINDISKQYFEYYKIIYQINNYEQIINSENKMFNINDFNNSLTKINGIIYLYYYLSCIEKKVPLKIPKFLFYKLSDPKFYLIDKQNTELDLPNDLVGGADINEEYIKINSNKSINLTFDNSKINNFIMSIGLYNFNININDNFNSDFKDSIPPSIEVVLDKFYEYNKIKIIIDIVKSDAKAIVDIKNSIKELIEKYNFVIDNTQKEQYYNLLFAQYIEEIIKDQSTLYLSKAVNKILVNNIDTKMSGLTDNIFKNTNIDFKIINATNSEELFSNYYLFLNKDVKKECKFLIYPNEYSTTNILKQKYCLTINHKIIELLVNNNADPYILDNDLQSVLNPIMKTYYHPAIDTLRKLDIDYINYNLPKDPLFILKQESHIHIKKMLDYDNNFSYINTIKNFVGPQLNEIKNIILSNEKFGNNVINYIDESFYMAFYLINEYLTDHLWKFTDTYTNQNMKDIFSITKNNETNISNNYLVSLFINKKINEPIQENNSKIVMKEYYDNILIEIKEITKKISTILKEKNQINNIIDKKIKKTLLNKNNQILNEYYKIRKEKDTRKYILTNTYNILINRNLNITNRTKIQIIRTYNRNFVMDSGPYNKIWSILFSKEDLLEESWNISLLKILMKEKQILENNNLKDKNSSDYTDFLIINNYYSHIKDISFEYFEGSKFMEKNKILSYIYHILIHLTQQIICFNIEMLLRNYLLKYFYDLDPKGDIIAISDKINYLLTSTNVTNKSINDILYKDIPEKFVKNSVKLFNNQNEKLQFEEESIKEILNNLFNLLTVGIISIPKDTTFMNILNKDLSEYFDNFVQKLILNWYVVIENTLKFVINQYRINQTIFELIK